MEIFNVTHCHFLPLFLTLLLEFNNYMFFLVNRNFKMRHVHTCEHKLMFFQNKISKPKNAIVLKTKRIQFLYLQEYVCLWTCHNLTILEILHSICENTSDG